MGLILDYIDGQSPFSEDEIEDLKIKSISTQKELNEFEQLNIEAALDWLMSRKLTANELLTEKFLKLLHLKMFNSVWFWAGSFRKSNKNIGVDWTNISVDIKNLLDDCVYWIENKTYSEEEIAIRFKHRLVSIHPFSNGNGRHSRLMADLILERIFDKPIFFWGGENLSATNEIRSAYINAVREADKGNYTALLEFAKSNRH